MVYREVVSIHTLRGINQLARYDWITVARKTPIGIFASSSGLNSPVADWEFVLICKMKDSCSRKHDGIARVEDV